MQTCIHYFKLNHVSHRDVNTIKRLQLQHEQSVPISVPDTLVSPGVIFPSVTEALKEIHVQKDAFTK